VATRPSQHWRTSAFADDYSEGFLRAVDAALDAFESDARTLAGAPDERVLAAVERVVVALNEVDANATDDSIDTDEREQLCLFIDEVLTENGVDAGELAARHGLARHAITDKWRRW
jgi:hypothetical protein